MNNQVHHEKEVLVAKMNQKTAVTTAIIGALVTVVAAVLPTAINYFYKEETSSVEQKSSISDSEKVTTTPSESTTPTPTETKGKGKKE